MNVPPRWITPIAAQIRDVAEVINTPFRFVQDALRFPKSERRCERRLQESLERRPNVLMVYSAPKTASTSVAAAIEACDAFTVIKVHHVQPEFFWPGVGTRLSTAHGGMRHKAIEQRTTQRFWRAMRVRFAWSRWCVIPLRSTSVTSRTLGAPIGCARIGAARVGCRKKNWRADSLQHSRMKRPVSGGSASTRRLWDLTH